MKNNDKLPPTQDFRCGTYAGSLAHRKRNEYRCENCKIAENTYRRELNAKNGKRKIYLEKWRKEHPDYDKQRKINNPEYFAKKWNEWFEANKDHRRRYLAQRIAQKKSRRLQNVNLHKCESVKMFKVSVRNNNMNDLVSNSYHICTVSISVCHQKKQESV